MKRIAWIMVLLLALSLAITGCAPQTEPVTGGPDTQNGTEPPAEGTTNTFTVGFDAEFPPMGFTDTDGSYIGFDLDLAAEVAKRMGKELKLQPIAWDSKDLELSSGNIDCIWNGFTINGREDDYEWTTPYMNNRQVMAVKDGAPYTTFADLAGKTIAIQNGSSAQSAFDANEEFKASVTAELTDDYLAALMNLEAGAVEGVLIDETVISYHIEKQEGKFMVLEESLASEAYGVGFKKGNIEFRDEVQEALNAMAADGTMAEISNQWFGKDITTIEASAN